MQLELFRIMVLMCGRIHLFVLYFPENVQYSSLVKIWRSSCGNFPPVICIITAARPAEHEVSPDDPFEFRTGLLQGGMDPFFTEPDQGSNFGFPRWAPPLEEPECAFCHSNTGDLKRCLGCKKVFYCGKQCQTQHWKEHKKRCQK